MTRWLGVDLTQGSTKRGIMVVLAAAAVYFFVPVEQRQEALLAIIGGHGFLGAILRDQS